jgi:8-hydroxy-5-deazaflavin:NADPH oxidoreductase
MQNTKTISIGIIGAGKIGSALATLWHQKGYKISMGVRDLAKAQNQLQRLRLPISAKTVKATVAENDIIVLAVPYSAVPEVTAEIKEIAANKIIIDATNPFEISPEGYVISPLGSTITAGSQMATLLPKSKIVRAFSHLMEELLVSRGTTQPGFFAVAIAGDDLDAKTAVSGLVQDAGFTPVDIGTLAESAPLDPGGVLFPKITAAEMRLMLK